jgi:Flp pilus assembly protein TadG
MTVRNLHQSGDVLAILWRGESATQIVEFALSLPLLVLFVVGIFDFSGAITLKQKLTNAAREGARVAAAGPASDLGKALIPASVEDAFYVVSNYLLSEKVNPCGLAGDPPALSGTLTWKSTATTGCPGAGLVLTINRGCIPQPVSTTTGNVVSTCVTIQYPYKWQYNNAASLLGISFTGPTSIKTTAASFNEN